MPRYTIRKTNGSIYEASHPEPHEGNPFAGLFSGKNLFFFRRVIFKPSPWWMFWKKGKWERTGEIWKPETGEFDVIPEKKEFSQEYTKYRTPGE